jgi:hypothetical protein
MSQNPYQSEVQLRLPIKPSWKATLDEIASFKGMSRLALIRSYIFEGIKRDLHQKKEIMQLEKQIKEKQYITY